jgi:D-arabinose 1-dehydrogenase-like Zn-dependent alcohol dehydrogenase
MGADFIVFKGSKTGDIVESKGHRDPKPTEVIVKISHCGVCGTDEHYRHADQGLGHEGIGIITEVGSMVKEISGFRVGDRVGMGWFHKFCGHCKSCVSGKSILPSHPVLPHCYAARKKAARRDTYNRDVGRQNQCTSATSFGNSDLDQGCFGTATAWDVSTLFKVPEEIASEDAGPLMCGGATVWTPLYDSGVRPGDRVGIIGVGGLGHLAIQFVAKMGFEAVVFSSTESKKEASVGFGASEFHTTQGVSSFDGVEKLDLLLVTTNVLPDMSLYVEPPNSNPQALHQGHRLGRKSNMLAAGSSPS